MKTDILIAVDLLIFILAYFSKEATFFHKINTITGLNENKKDYTKETL